MARGAWECSPTRSKRQHSGYGDSLEEQRAGGAEALSHDGRPRGSEKPKPTTFETLTGNNRSLRSSGAVGAYVHLQGPPLLLVPISEATYDLHPISRRIRIFPLGTQSRLPQRAYLLALAV